VGDCISSALKIGQPVSADIVSDLDSFPGTVESVKTALPTLVLQIGRVLFKNQVILEGV